MMPEATISGLFRYRQPAAFTGGYWNQLQVKNTV